MTQDELETVYGALAMGIDSVAPEQRELYLAKVALALAEKLGNVPLATAVIEECKAGIDCH